MTAHPIPENFGHWWLTTASRWERLHAVPARNLTRSRVQNALDEGQPIRRNTACHRTLHLAMPGPFNRMGMPRCALCCKALGIPAGYGTPANENYRRAAAAGWRTARHSTSSGVQLRSALGRAYIRQGNQPEPVIELDRRQWATTLAHLKKGADLR